MKEVAATVGLFISFQAIYQQIATFVSPLMRAIASKLSEWHQSFDTQPSVWQHKAIWNAKLDLHPEDWHRAQEGIVFLTHYRREKPARSRNNQAHFATDAVLDRLAGLMYDSLPRNLGGTADAKLEVFSKDFSPVPMISHAEMGAVHRTVEVAEEAGLLEGLSKATFHQDNQVTMWNLRKGHSNDVFMADKTREILKTLRKFGIYDVLVLYVTSQRNTDADTISRWDDFWADWAVQAVYMREIARWRKNKRLPIPTIDGFAARHNRLFSKYCSRYMDVGSSGNFFSFENYEQEVWWLNPPFCLLLQLLALVIAKSLRAFVLAPYRPDLDWFPLTREAKHVFRIQPREGIPIFKPSSVPAKGWKQPSTDINVYYFE